MADQLYLSYWLRGFTEHNMLRHWERMLLRFPFSRLSPRAELTVHAIALTEAPLLVREFNGEIPVDGVLEASRGFLHADTGFVLETAWDIWQLETEWRLLPAQVTLNCFGPLFPSERGEQLLIEFGLDAPFLPSEGEGNPLAPVRHNIRGLLHLVEDLDSALAVDKRQLWSESGENFAERLQAALR